MTELREKLDGLAVEIDKYSVTGDRWEVYAGVLRQNSIDEILVLVKEAGYGRLSDMRKVIAVEWKKAAEEAKANPFQVKSLDYEHCLLWTGHANAHSETVVYIDELIKQADGK